MNTATLIYIANTRRTAANDLLLNAGYSRPASSPGEMVEMLKDYIDLAGERAVNEIMAIHPDRNHFVKALPEHEEKRPSQPWHACDSCDKKLNCIAADGTFPGQPGLSEKSINMLIIGGAAVFAVALVTVIVVNSK